jgi:hypothetical protein
MAQMPESYCLRNHIPISAPATREPCDGSESPLRVSLGFTPRWYHQRLGIDFAEEWHLEAAYRYETLVTMKRHLHECFPLVPYFQPQYRGNGIEPSCATISGVFGIMLISAIYGLEIDYRSDNWPDARGGATLSKDELISNAAPDVGSAPIVQQLFGQMDQIEERWGAIHGYLNYQGILNVALKLRGNAIFLDLIDDPDFARSLFAGIAATIRAVSSMVQARQRASGFAVDLLSMSNCVMNMVSPDTYGDFVLPLDRELSRHYSRFGIHTCNWDATPYLSHLRTVEKMGYLDTGQMADLKQIREAFPTTRRAVLYSPLELETKSEAEIESDLTRIRDLYSPCDIVLADVEVTTPDSRVNSFLRIAGRLEKERPATG